MTPGQAHAEQDDRPAEHLLDFQDLREEDVALASSEGG
jgi:hypothetical protein